MKIEERLEKELQHTVGRLRPGAVGTMTHEPAARSDVLADSMDAIQIGLDREVGFATRSRLLERASRLAFALELVRDGAYGVCEECQTKIAAARLRAIPEVTTCVRCQERREQCATAAATPETADVAGDAE